MTLRILSLGCGVQSTTLFYMACEGILPGLDYAVFADTQAEPPWVYETLELLTIAGMQAGIPLVCTSRGNLMHDMLTSNTRVDNPPFFTRNRLGRHGMLLRKCTREYKSRPIDRVCRMLKRIHKATHIEQWFGISIDEAGRMRNAPTRAVSYRYPLIDLRMTRQQCLRWLEERGYPLPGKSACIMCPYHSTGHWRELQRHQDVWKKVVDFDAEIRQKPWAKHALYLHSSCLPVDEALSQDNRQRDMFLDECEGVGVCFV